VESGEDIGDLPLTIADVEVELPAADSGAGLVTSSVVEKPVTTSGARRRRKWVLATALTGIVALLAMAWVGYLLSTQPSGAATGDARPGATALAASTTPSAPGAPSVVRIDVESTPPNAAVLVENELRGRTPVALSLPRGDAPLSLRLELEDHAPLEEHIVPNVDQRLRLSLLPSSPEASDDASGERRPRTRSSARRRNETMRGDPADRFRRWD
jgi:hypothetical protein